MQNDAKNLVSVIIPALHRPDLTERCIRSLLEQSLSLGGVEIVVVENEARPGEVFQPPPGHKVRVIELDKNYGTTGSINRACTQSSSKYVLFLNNDVELHPTFLDSLIAVLEQNDRYAFATGKLLCAHERDHFDGAGDAMLAGGGTYRLGRNELDSGQYDSCMPVIAGCGAATLFRRSALEQVGGLDEDFFAYIDDVDLGLRLHLYGYRGLYIPSAIALHVGSATLGGDSLHPKIIEWITRNQILLIVKNYPGPVLRRCFPRIIIFQMLWLAFVLARGRVGAYGKGVLGAVRLLGKTFEKRQRLQRQQRITNADFLSALLSSEAQVYKWHTSQQPSVQSRLLRVYFWIFHRQYV